MYLLDWAVLGVEEQLAVVPSDSESMFAVVHSRDTEQRTRPYPVDLAGV